MGIEPTLDPSKTPEKTVASHSSDTEVSRIGSRSGVSECPQLSSVVSKWSALPYSAREAIAQLVNTFVKEDSR
jgi:hypothetical protein